MGIDRRQFITALACVVAVSPRKIFAATTEQKFLASRNVDGQNLATVFTAKGEITAEYSLPGRGHGGAYSARTGHAVLFARRPDHFAVVLDQGGDRLYKQIESPADRYFFGHGFYSADGELLFATENDFDNRQSVLGIYAVNEGYKRIAEIDCGGIGAHETILLSDQQTAVIAIGGIETHPDYPRQKLNIPDMRPSLNFLNLKDKKIIGKYYLPDHLHKLSIRHITEGENGSVLFAGQYEGTKSDIVPLLGVKRSGVPNIETFVTEPDILTSLRSYVGSIAAHPSTNSFAITAPRGNMAYIMEGGSGQPMQTISIDDICGVAANTNDYMFSTGRGTLLDAQKSVHHLDVGHWDNHITALV